jgi:hypothetical protein
VMAQFARDRLVFSDVLEMSFSCDPSGDHVYRFSYAFPGFRDDEAGVSATLLAWCELFGPQAAEACRTVLRAARSRVVTQPLFGFAYDSGGPRVKLYLQFDDSGPRAALDLASRILSRPLRDLESAGRLHLLCLDLGERGLAGAKLYFVRDHLPLAALEAEVGPVPLVSALADLGVTALRDLLLIHRTTGPEDDGLMRASEVDFSLPDNDVLWSDVRRLPHVNAHLARSPHLAELASAFRLAMRRVSGSVGDGRKLNVYYTLAEAPRGSEVTLAG